MRCYDYYQLLYVQAGRARAAPPLPSIPPPLPLPPHPLYPLLPRALRHSGLHALFLDEVEVPGHNLVPLGLRVELWRLDEGEEEVGDPPA